MAKKRQETFLFAIAIAIAILVTIFYILRYSDRSPVGAFVQWISGKVEGFDSAPIDIPMCPKDYKFFNDEKGESLCCAGKVDPYKHVCESKESDDLCAFVPGIDDPRDITKKAKLPLCSDVSKRQQERMELEFCPKSLPNHARLGKCCAGASDPVTGDCFPSDLNDLNRYCLTTAPRREQDRGVDLRRVRADNEYYDDKNGKWAYIERSCANVRRSEEAQCPSRDFFKTSMDFFRDGKNKQIPYCMNGPRGCVPKSSFKLFLTSPEAAGVKNPDRSILNCDVYKKVVIDKDLSFPVERY